HDDTSLHLLPLPPRTPLFPYTTLFRSLKSTTPTNKARIAPPIADQPIDNPFGCQITKTRVIKKINDASKTDDVKSFYSHRLFFRSEEHTSELQSRFDLVCRLLLEKKNT